MRYSRLLLAIVIAPVLTSSASTSVDPEPVISIDNCREPADPLGQFQATGIIRVPLTPDGRPDTTRIEVGSVQGLSAPGLRSVAARQLASCRFRIRPKPDAELLVLQQFQADSGVVSIRSIPAAGRVFTALAWTIPPIPAEPLAATDTLLDEKPRHLKCKFKMHSPMTTTVVTSQAQMDAALREVQRQGTGDVAFTYVVGPDGRFVKGSATLRSSSNPSITKDALTMYEACRFAPGRIAGVPVSTRMEGRLQSRVSVGP